MGHGKAYVVIDAHQCEEVLTLWLGLDSTWEEEGRDESITQNYKKKKKELSSEIIDMAK